MLFFGATALLPAAAQSPEQTLFGASVPATVSASDTAAVELGVKFQSAVAGQVRGIRFYKGSGNTGTHSGSLWNTAGTRLATAIFSNETASGWQEVRFSTPVSITANTTYVASYFAPVGGYSINSNYFTSALTSGDLTAPVSTPTDGNGVYKYNAASAFPDQTWNASNYWVDVIFTADAAPSPTGSPSPTATPEPTPVAIFSDGFEAALDWTRTGDTAWYTGTPKNGTHSVRLRTTGAIQKTISLTGYEHINVSFTMGANSLDSAAENVQALYYNGTSWVVLATIANNSANENNKLNPYNLSLPATVDDLASFGLRFKLNGSGTNDYAYIDDVVVTGTAIVIPTPTATPTPTPPTADLAASPNTIVAGESATLSWTSTNATACTGTGFVTGNAPNGTVSVSPPVTTTYDISCSGAGGTATASAVVTVIPVLAVTATADPTTGITPLTVAFTGTATGGTGTYSYLWDFGDNSNSNDQDSTHIYQGPGTYNATVTVTSGTQTKTASVSVEVAAPQPTADLTASTAEIISGETATLTWSSTDATTCTGTGFETDNTASGSISVSPTETTTYSLSCTGAGGSASDSVTVTVIPLLTVSAAGNPMTGTTPLTVDFTGTATGGTGDYAYSWDFGDASTASTEQNPTHVYEAAGSYTATVTVTSGTQTKSASTTVTVTAPTPPPTPTPTPDPDVSQSLFSTSDTPNTVTTNDPSAVELGVKFKASQDGQILGIRFYKGPQNTGTHTGSLWSSNGTRLATATFTDETASGWQEVRLTSPVAITADTTYVASYFAPQGYYSANGNYFAADYTSGVITAPASSSSGGNGVYSYTASSAFPTQSYNATNYWVDVVFSTTQSTPTPTPSPTPTPAPITVALPIAPQPYDLPNTYTAVSDTAEFIAAFTSATAKDIVLSDGVYEHTSFVEAGAPHRVWAEHLGGAELRFGLSLGTDREAEGGELHGLKFNVTDDAKTFYGGIVNIWGTGGNNMRIYDTSINGNHATAHGIVARTASGLVIERVVVENMLDNGITIQAVSPDNYTYVPAIHPVLRDIEIHHIYRTPRGSADGTAEAGLWLGTSGNVERIRVTNTGWMGIWTGSNANDASLRDITIDNIYNGDAAQQQIGSGSGIYVEHTTRRALFERFQIGSATHTPWEAGYYMPSGITTESKHGGDSASQYTIFRNGIINSSHRGGLFQDTTQNMVENVRFVNQSAAAIIELRTDGLPYDLDFENNGNSYAGMLPGAIVYTNDYQPLGFFIQPIGASATAGTSVTLSAQGAGGYSAFTYQWRKDGENIVGATGSNYSFSASNETAGTYSVVATNNEGSVTSIDAIVEVMEISPTPTPTPTPDPEDSPVKLGINADLGGMKPFTADDPWNQNIENLPLHPEWGRIQSEMDALNAGWREGRDLRADFGSGTYNGSPIGIPYIVAPIDQPLVPIINQAYGGDEGPYPMPPNTPIENINHTDYADRHAIVVQRDTSKPNHIGHIFELFRAYPQGDYPNSVTDWWASSYAKFDANSNTLQSRTIGQLSTDAAGLPIFPGLVRYDEVQHVIATQGRNGDLGHALRFTVNEFETEWSLIQPATEVAGYNTGPIPFGSRWRLRADWVVPAEWPDELAVIINTLRRYGMLQADNSDYWAITGAPDERWNNAWLSHIRYIKAGDFEMVDTGPIIYKSPGGEVQPTPTPTPTATPTPTPSPTPAPTPTETAAPTPDPAVSQSIFSAADTPTTVTTNDTGAVELGVKFHSAVDGYVSGIRFYKGPENFGTHTVTLWTTAGEALATATATNETPSGWQTANFASPVAITAGTTYVASYHAPVGKYSSNSNYFNADRVSGDLTASSSASAGGNGIYLYSASSAFSDTDSGA